MDMQCRCNPSIVLANSCNTVNHSQLKYSGKYNIDNIVDFNNDIFIKDFLILLRSLAVKM